MEIWDLYDRERRLTGQTMVRGARVPDGMYHLIVDALFLNSKGETLLQRRAKSKHVMPDIWSVAGGSAIRGEDSAAACAREVKEEMGFDPDFSHGRVLMSDVTDREGKNFIRDVWLFFQDVPLSQMAYQPEEVQDGMWIMPEIIEEDPRLWRELNELFFWPKAYPHLMLESMRLRIPPGEYVWEDGKTYQAECLVLDQMTMRPVVICKALFDPMERWSVPAGIFVKRASPKPR